MLEGIAYSWCIFVPSLPIRIYEAKAKKSLKQSLKDAKSSDKLSSLMVIHKDIFHITQQRSDCSIY